MTDEAQLRAAMEARRGEGGGSSLRVLPGPDEARDPEGCIVVERLSGSWSVYRQDRGPQDVRSFTSEAEAFDHAHRRWVLGDRDA